VLTAARNAGAPIPTGEIVGEEPDFTFKMEQGQLGIELTELLPPASTDGGISPVEQAAFYGDVVRIAKEKFRRQVGGRVRVGLYFGDREGGRTRRNKQEMARSLFQCVKDNLHRATPFVHVSDA